MGSNGFWCQFDAFAKPLKDFRVQTVSGALVSILSSVVILFLFFSELIAYTTPQAKQEIVVDIDRGRKLSIELDVSYLFIPCTMLNLDTMDSTGEQKIDVSQQIYKTRIDSTGSPISATRRDDGNPSKGQVVTKGPDYCGSCYGAESETRKCCNTCKEIQLAYQERHWVVKNLSVFEQCREEQWDDTLANLGSEGCRIQGSLQVNKVAGSFHITPGNSYASDQVHVHNLQGFDGQKLNMSHKIDKLAFGNMYPGQTNPLDGTTMNVVEHGYLLHETCPDYVRFIQYHAILRGFRDYSSTMSFLLSLSKSPMSITVTPFRCLAAMPPEGSTRTEILPGCPSLDRRSRKAEVVFKPLTFRSVNSSSNHLSHLAPETSLGLQLLSVARPCSKEKIRVCWRWLQVEHKVDGNSGTAPT
ncbi:Endoplasmic reticulum-Golgi intermediate compartment protein 3 [Clonorchis sinensis]|uniref:Endoplasmic reticulum-Golgi intermediate compartment protein 3 n=1 Tax=Clonorchis sinensis TaxID=79923 RepID=A0A3R7D3E3_CLOSI|nr:Endoplasmic reticulum-Golgi intermediate compartment protein 3 [Clonorchis sinensis]